MGLGNHFVTCDICGSPGHKARNCAANEIEKRKDPFGEDARRRGYLVRNLEGRRRKQLSASAASLNAQTSRSFGL